MNLFEQAQKIFLCQNPDEKIALTLDCANLFEQNKLSWNEGLPIIDYLDPGKEPQPFIVAPKDLKSYPFKKLYGKANAIHALAHIELTAVNLAWDSVYRFRGLPKDYYSDWVQCAKEEATHFKLLCESLKILGFNYGDFKVHGELWAMARTTRHSLLERMGVVHRILEARALDAIPMTSQRFSDIGDRKMVDTLNIIGNEEIGHISSSTRWFKHQCDLQQVNSDQTFIQLVNKFLANPPKGPFNREARLASGFSEYELNELDRMDREFKPKPR
ncbi:ferritin-like domain-containing protein [Marinicellulosiphila megalodicopiae]|uniref:ferritin-like domain-containing protein n=1 Tax=Marinicellulosiphila megalodicopiae TaxID=2724896 RepID=UPI003BAF9E63